MTKSVEQEILDNAPKGNFKSVKMWGKRPAIWLPDVYRSLDDIRKIIALQNENAEKDKRIQKLKAKCDKAWDILEHHDDDSKIYDALCVLEGRP